MKMAGICGSGVMVILPHPLGHSRTCGVSPTDDTFPTIRHAVPFAGARASQHCVINGLLVSKDSQGCLIRATGSMMLHLPTSRSIETKSVPNCQGGIANSRHPSSSSEEGSVSREVFCNG